MDDALKHCAELKALFRRQTGGWMDPERLSRVNELCTRGAASAGDVLRERILLSIDSIEDHLNSGPA